MRRTKHYNTENLIQFDEMPPERHRELSARGGIASGEKRRAKAELRKSLNAMWEKAMLTEGWIDDIKAYRAWKKRRDRARDKREHAKENSRKRE